ncbi:MAG: hypothetical protein JSV20_03655, partial [Candidatus Bathyarchaeota archaeon]
MITLNDLISLAERVVKKAETYGAQEAESYISWTKSLEGTIQGGLINLREGETAGLGVRAVLGKRVGFAAVSSIEEAKMFEAAQNAVKVARIRPKDSKFFHLPDPVRGPSKRGVFDDNMLTVTADELLQKTSLIVKEAEDMDKWIRFVQGGIDVNIKQFAVANSRGINTGDAGTGISGSVNCKAIESGEEQMGFESISSRKLIDFSGIGHIAAKRAVESLGSQKLKEPRTLPVLFDNYTSSIFLSLLSYGVSARSVQEGRSVLCNKLGNMVASKNLTIIDDAWMADGLNTVRCDAEGIPTTV